MYNKMMVLEYRTDFIGHVSMALARQESKQNLILSTSNRLQ
jgi:hypothetical protein